MLSEAGLAGIEFANPKDATRYHLPRDTTDAIDLDHLQAHGDTVTSLVRGFGEVDLQRERDENDRVFTTLPAIGIVSLASRASAAFAVVALVAVVLLVAYQLRQNRIGGQAVVRGIVATGVVIASLVITATIIWELVIRVQGGDDTKDFPDFDGSDVALTALYAGIGAAFVWAVARYARRRDPVEVAVGGLAWLGALHIVLMVESPLAVSLTTWPLLAGVGGILAWTADRPRLVLPVLFVAAAPSLLLLVPQLTLWVDSPSEPIPSWRSSAPCCSPVWFLSSQSSSAAPHRRNSVERSPHTLTVILGPGRDADRHHVNRDVDHADAEWSVSGWQGACRLVRIQVPRLAFPYRRRRGI